MPLPRQHPQQQLLRPLPQRIEFDSELPYNETGKLLRRELKAARIADLQAAED